MKSKRAASSQNFLRTECCRRGWICASKLSARDGNDFESPTFLRTERIRTSRSAIRISLQVFAQRVSRASCSLTAKGVPDRSYQGETGLSDRILLHSQDSSTFERSRFKPSKRS